MWRELRAYRMILESLTHKLQNERVRWFSDNQNFVRIIELGTAEGGPSNLLHKKPNQNRT